MPELKDYLNSINQTKINLMEGDSDEARVAEKQYTPYIINRCMAGHQDTVLLANEMNMRPYMPKKAQYGFYLSSVRTRKRFAPWLKAGEEKNIELVKVYYKCSHSKAREILNILTQDEIDYIKIKTETGGKL